MHYYRQRDVCTDGNVTPKSVPLKLIGLAKPILAEKLPKLVPQTTFVVKIGQAKLILAAKIGPLANISPCGD